MAGAAGAHDDYELRFREWAAAQRAGEGTVAFGDRLERDLGRAYERIDSLLDEADQLQGVGDELEAAKRRAFVARQGCSALTRAIEDPAWHDRLSVAESLLTHRARATDFVMRNPLAWRALARSERRLLRAAEVSDKRAARLLADARGEYLQRFARHGRGLSAKEIDEYLDGARRETCALAETLETSYKRLASRRSRTRFIRYAVGGVLLVAADAAPGVATAGALAAMGAATSTAAGGAILGAALK